MPPRPFGTQLNAFGEIVWPAPGGDLFAALFRSSTLGLAICDRQLRFRAINDALASMNGVPAAAHLGKTLQSVLGRVAKKIRPAYEHVFSTGQPLVNFEVTAKLPTRDAIGYWNESYLPIKDAAGKVQHVGTMVLELTRCADLENSLLRLREMLARVASGLCNPSGDLSPVGVNDAGAGSNELFARSIRLLETCMSETRAISQFLSAAPLLRRFPVPQAAGGSASPVARHQDSVGVSQVEEFDLLSPREREVAALLASGKTNKQIAAMLSISTRTVESHRARIMLKLDLHSISDLVRFALRARIIQA